MMRSVLALVPFLAAVLGTPGPLAAQSHAQCNGFLFEQTRNICNAGFDGVRTFLPVAGVLVSGGNPLLGATGGMGGLSHGAVTFRASTTDLVLPDFSYNGVGRTVGAGDDVSVPVPVVELSSGILRGGRNGVFALDFLSSIHLLPQNAIDGLRVSDEAHDLLGLAWSFGYGLRMTVVPEGRVIPEIAVSAMRRSLPRVQIGSLDEGDRFTFGTNLKSRMYRVLAAKGFGPLVIGGGFGWDRYQADADVIFLDPITNLPYAPIKSSFDERRELRFLNAGLVLRGVRIVAEWGTLAGSSDVPGTTFEKNDPREERWFGGLGIRFGF